jgi:anthranilate synthase component 1
VRKFIADTLTPVSIYLKVRDQFEQAALLEANNFTSARDCLSFIGWNPISSFTVRNGKVEIAMDGETTETTEVVDQHTVPLKISEFLGSFDVEYEDDYPYSNGLFGHTNFEACQYFDTLAFASQKRKTNIPDIRYFLFRFLIAFNHFKDEIYLIENSPDGNFTDLDALFNMLKKIRLGFYPFEPAGERSSNLTDDEFMDLVRLGKHHCKLGDVFQIVLSRAYRQSFQGDDFNVYRVLRSINPSPYLFYFEFGSYRIFGSSPEAQMVIKGQSAIINPIAGTYRRTGDAHEDIRHGQELSRDPKENAEHVMLVDLARNDLGKHSDQVRVLDFKSVKFFSHVIHLVSEVEGVLAEGTNKYQIFADTFPAGTLSGAPKFKAIELIGQYENESRDYYGGSIGFIDFNGDMNQAITIRTFLSKDGYLHSQAGAGITVQSDESKELEEVNNKLLALTNAILEAKKNI